MMGWTAKILVLFLAGAVPSTAAELVCAGLYEKLKFSTAKLNAEQAATLAKIQDVFERRVSRRLAELSPEMRKRVEAKLEALEITTKLGSNRGGVVAGKTPFERMMIPRETLGDIYLNEKLQKNLYALFTVAHELEHTIDILTVQNRLLGLTRESFRLKPFTLRTERNAFAANHSLFEELKASGVSLEQMVDVMVQMDPQLRQHHQVIMGVVGKYTRTGKRPHWFQLYEEITELMLMDRTDATSYAAIRIHNGPSYQRDIAGQRSAALTQWAAVTAAAGVASYLGYSQLDFEKAVDARHTRK